MDAIALAASLLPVGLSGRPKSFNRALRQRFRHMRRSMHISQRQLAAVSGHAPPQICLFERGSEHSNQMLVDLCAGLISLRKP